MCLGKNTSQPASVRAQRVRRRGLHPIKECLHFLIQLLVTVRFFTLHLGYTGTIKENREDKTMKGYYNNSGYMGYVGGRWVLFACESDYVEYMEG